LVASSYRYEPPPPVLIPPWDGDRMSTQADATAQHEAVRAWVSGLLRDVLDHHRPTDYGLGPQCRGCDQGPRPEDYADWPCSTWAMIAAGSVPRGTVTG
jgi:hypothetical protein